MTNVFRVIRLARIRRRKRKTFRRKRNFNPFDGLSEQDIFNKYRFQRATIEFILSLIRPQLLRPTGRSMAVSPLVQLITTLRFYATGNFYQLVGDSLGLSAATVCRIVHSVSVAIASLAERYIVFPNGTSALAAKRSFYHKSGFPHVLGALGVMLIKIPAPRINESDYVNSEGYHSLNIQMSCDTKYIITSCEAKWPGSVHDAQMFEESCLNRQFENGEHDGLLVGHSAYPCKKYLVTPYVNTNSTSHELYNNSLSRAREHIEQTIGILKRRFSCLQTGLRISPDNARFIILACVVLHNIGIQQGDIIQMDNEVDIDDNTPQDGEGATGNQDRDLIRLLYFT